MNRSKSTEKQQKKKKNPPKQFKQARPESLAIQIKINNFMGYWEVWAH